MFFIFIYIGHCIAHFLTVEKILKNKRRFLSRIGKTYFYLIMHMNYTHVVIGFCVVSMKKK